MHYKDGTPAKLGDIVQHDSGAVGIVLGGTIGNDYCSTQVLKFVPAASGNVNNQNDAGAGYIGTLRDEKYAVVARGAVVVTFDHYMQTRECLKIGHIDVGQG